MRKINDSFEEELLKIQEALYNYAYILTKDKDDAKDLLQETMIKTLANRNKYIPNTNIKGWAYTIMKNIFLNKSHRDCRINSLLYSCDKQDILNTPYTQGFVTHNKNCTINEIKLAIASFPNEYRIPFSMYSVGYKYEEIATYMHIPLGTVKSRIYYTRKKLQILLKDYREDL